MPLLNDGRTEEFVEDIGERLIAAIPGELRQPAFQYSFDVVNLRDINAFALPGGPMFLNRGMIQSARTEGEVAGVMAHELAHVVLRHGTAQASKGQKFQIGAIAGQILGAIVGGRTGDVIAQGSQIGLGTYFLKYGREYERQADLLGAQLMARAGYDPRQMATMFQTIERQGGNRGPEWLSSHPNPGNRIEAINREAAMLQVARVERLQRRLLVSSGEAEADARGADRRTGRTRSGRQRRAGRHERPERAGRAAVGRVADVSAGPVPAAERAGQLGTGWRQLGHSDIRAGRRLCEKASSFTHGIQVGVARRNGGNLQQQTDRLLQGFAQSNPKLRRQGGYSRTTIGGRQGLTTTLSNVSSTTGEPEAVNVSTVQLSDGSVLFLVGVAPAGRSADLLQHVRPSQTVGTAADR